MSIPKIVVNKYYYAFAIVILNAANGFLVPQLHIAYLVGFLSVVINGAIVLFTQVSQQAQKKT